MTSCWVSVLPPCSSWPAPGVHPQHAQYTARINTVVGIEIAVLHRLQRRRQHRRHLLGRDDDTILAVNRKYAADQQRLKARDGHLLAPCSR